MAKKQYIDFVSPRGTAKYPKCDQPYSFNQRLNRSQPDPEGQYELTLLMSPEDAGAIKKKVEEAIKIEGIKPANLPYKKEVDKDTSKETGLVEVKFKAYGKKKDGSVNRISFVDAKGKALPSSFRLTSGSVVKVAGYVSVAKLGARLNLRSVQVINYVPYEDNSNPFTEEDGFVYDEADFADNPVSNGPINSETDGAESYDF